MTTKIAPSLLAANPLEYGPAAERAIDAGADWLHIDVMDGNFVPPITFGAALVRALREHPKVSSSNVALDVHLMIVRPDLHLEDFAAAGADMITVHWEACPHLHRVLGEIKRLGCQAGVAINPATPVSVLQAVIDQVDLVLLMSVNPGWGGQKFIPGALGKISEIKDLCNLKGVSPYIEVDGGIDEQTGPQCIAAGANVLVAGSYLYSQSNMAEGIKSLSPDIS